MQKHTVACRVAGAIAVECGSQSDLELYLPDIEVPTFGCKLRRKQKENLSFMLANKSDPTRAQRSCQRVDSSLLQAMVNDILHSENIHLLAVHISMNNYLLFVLS